MTDASGSNTEIRLENRRGAAGVTGAAGTGSGVNPCCDIGPSMVGDCEGAGNGAGIRLSKVLGSGVGKFIRGGKKSVALGLRRGLGLHVVPKHVRTCAEARFSVLSNRNCAISLNLPQFDQTGGQHLGSQRGDPTECVARSTCAPLQFEVGRVAPAAPTPTPKPTRALRPR
jgi:hypothetical protein